MQEPQGHETGRIYFPSSPTEFITVFAHFHRAEIARMAGWRDRIDRTTNWAITLVAAAIGNAVFDATGARLREVPFTPERVKAALGSLKSEV